MPSPPRSELASLVAKLKSQGVTASTLGRENLQHRRSRTTIVNNNAGAMWALAALHTPAALRERKMLRHNRKVLAELDLWWVTAQRSMVNAGREQSTQMVEEEYVKVSKKIYRAMIYPYDEQDATENAKREWLDDVKLGGCAGRLKHLPEEKFKDAMFELADLWTARIDALEYAQWLRQLFNHIAAGEPPAQYLWLPDEQIVHGGYSSPHKRRPDAVDSPASAAASCGDVLASPAMRPPAVRVETLALDEDGEGTLCTTFEQPAPGKQISPLRGGRRDGFAVIPEVAAVAAECLRPKSSPQKLQPHTARESQPLLPAACEPLLQPPRTAEAAAPESREGRRDLPAARPVEEKLWEVGDGRARPLSSQRVGRPMLSPRAKEKEQQPPSELVRQLERAGQRAGAFGDAIARARIRASAGTLQWPMNRIERERELAAEAAARMLQLGKGPQLGECCPRGGTSPSAPPLRRRNTLGSIEVKPALAPVVAKTFCPQDMLPSPNNGPREPFGERRANESAEAPAAAFGRRRRSQSQLGTKWSAVRMRQKSVDALMKTTSENVGRARAEAVERLNSAR